ncbi:MAG: hypothetical protein MUE51_15050, partial [Thermoleophilia bacterium]|nr:hypothetical protein [Thermoleophilia bacterium]
LIALRLRREDPRAGWWAGGLGLCLGLGLWLNPVAFFLLIPAALWALASGRGRLRALIPWAAGGAVLGALPFLVHHIPRGFEGITGYRQPPSSVADRLGGLWDPVLGMFLGARHIGTGAPVGAEWLAVLLGVLALAGLAAALWVRRRGLLDLVLLRASRRAPVDVVLVALVLALAGYVASSYGWYTGEPRYLQSVYPALAVALAWAVHACGRWAVPVAAAALTAWAALTVAGIDAYRDSGGGGGFAEGVLVRPEDLPAVADALVARGVRTAYADYWLAYPLQFAAGDGLRVAATTYIRFPEDNRAAEDDPAAAVVVPTGPPADRVQALLGARGATFRRADVRGIAIFTRITPRTPPRALGLSPPWSFGVGG